MRHSVCTVYHIIIREKEKIFSQKRTRNLTEELVGTHHAQPLPILHTVRTTQHVEMERMNRARRMTVLRSFLTGLVDKSAADVKGRVWIVCATAHFFLLDAVPYTRLCTR